MSDEEQTNGSATGQPSQAVEAPAQSVNTLTAGSEPVQTAESNVPQPISTTAQDAVAIGAAIAAAIEHGQAAVPVVEHTDAALAPLDESDLGYRVLYDDHDGQLYGALITEIVDASANIVSLFVLKPTGPVSLRNIEQGNIAGTWRYEA